MSLFLGWMFGFRWYTTVKKSLQNPYHTTVLTWRTVLFFCSFLSFLIASWFTATQSELQASDHEIVLALDVSQSMLVEDMWPKKSRLAYAKEKINELVIQMPTAKWWLTVFAWETQSILPLTNDTSLFLTFLAWVDHRNLTKQWTQLIEAIRESSQRFDFTTTTKKTLLVISDGWDDTIVPDEELKAFITSGSIQVLVVGIWTASWWPIPAWVDLFWNVLTKQRENKTVISTLQEQSLRSVAESVWWTYNKWNNALFDAIDKTIIQWTKWFFVWWWIRTFLFRLWTLFFLWGVSIQWVNQTKRNKSFFAYFSRYEKK